MACYDVRVIEEIYKLCSVNLSPNVTGQLAMGLMCNPPRPGSESYALHMKEKDLLLQSLIRRARLITDAFNRCVRHQKSDMEAFLL